MRLVLEKRNENQDDLPCSDRDNRCNQFLVTISPRAAHGLSDGCMTPGLSYVFTCASVFSTDRRRNMAWRLSNWTLIACTIAMLN